MRLPIVAVAVLGILSACAPAAPQAAPTAATTQPTAGPQASVSMGYSNIAGAELALWYALDTGAFAAHGVQVDAQLVSGGANTMAALLAGQL